MPKTPMVNLTDINEIAEAYLALPLAALIPALPGWRIVRVVPVAPLPDSPHLVQVEIRVEPVTQWGLEPPFGIGEVAQSEEATLTEILQQEAPPLGPMVMVDEDGKRLDVRHIYKLLPPTDTRSSTEVAMGMREWLDKATAAIQKQ